MLKWMRRGNILACLFISFLTVGVRAQVNRGDFCHHFRDPHYFKTRAYDPGFRLHEANQGGLFNGGVCWWHSRLQRSIWYLSVMRPDLPRPNRWEAASLVNRLASNSGVVEIPGYQTFDDFSRDWWSVIQKKLNDWQLVDGFLKQAWIGNMKSRPRINPWELQEKMKALYGVVEGQSHIAWVMLKFPGILSHAWLVVDMMPSMNGYELSVVDSNFPRDMKTVFYARGTGALSTIYGATVPYLGRQGDFEKFEAAAENYCQSSGPSLRAFLPLENNFE